MVDWLSLILSKTIVAVSEQLYEFIFENIFLLMVMLTFPSLFFFVVIAILSIGEKKCLNTELWHACAGPLVCLPSVGSRVVYFPQGHSEQVSR